MDDDERDGASWIACLLRSSSHGAPSLRIRIGEGEIGNER